MRKLIIILVFIFLYSPVWATVFYVEPDATNPSTAVMYDTNGWPVDNTGTRTTGSNINDVCVAAGDPGADEVRLSGGTSGVTYSNEMLDGAAAAAITCDQPISVGTDSGHDGMVTILADAVVDDDAIYANVGCTSITGPITLTAQGVGEFGLYLSTAQSFISNDITIVNSVSALRQQTSGDYTVIHNRLTIESCTDITKQIVLGNTTAAAGTHIFNSPQFLYNAGSQFLQINDGTLLEINNGHSVGNEDSVLYWATGADMDAVITNHSFVANAWASNSKLINKNSQGVTVTTNNCGLLPKAFDADNYEWDIDTNNNAVYGGPRFALTRYPAYAIFSMDDYSNYDDWKTFADFAETIGARVVLNIDDVWASSIDWDEIATYAANGHEFACHAFGGNDSQLVSLEAITLTSLPANTQVVISDPSRGNADPENWALTIDYQENCDSECSSISGFPISITFDANMTDTYDTIGEVRTALVNAGATVDIHANTGSGAPAIVLTPGIYTSGQTINYDNSGTAGDNVIEKYWYVFVAWAKARLENLISASINYGGTYNAVSFVAPGHNTTAPFIAWLIDDTHFSPLGTDAFKLVRGENGWTASYDLSSIDMSDVVARSMADMDGVDYTRCAAAAANTMGVNGWAVFFFSHGFTSLSQALHEAVLDEFVKTPGIRVVTAAALETIVRDSGDWSDSGNGYLYNRTLTDNADYHIQQGPYVNTGTNPYSDGDGDQYDYAGNKIWNDTTDASESAWSDGVDIGAYGFFGGNVLLMGL